MSEPVVSPQQLSDLWNNEFVINNLCGLCGNSGFIDTRNHVFSAAGVSCGGRFECICPNGRSIKRGISPTAVYAIN